MISADTGKMSALANERQNGAGCILYSGVSVCEFVSLCAPKKPCEHHISKTNEGNISPNFGRRCIRVRRCPDWILASKGQRSRSQIRPRLTTARVYKLYLLTYLLIACAGTTIDGIPSSSKHLHQFLSSNRTMQLEQSTKQASVSVFTGAD